MVLPCSLPGLAAVVLLGAAARVSAQFVGSCVYDWPASPGETCEKMAADWELDLDYFIRINPGIQCPDLIHGQWYCVQWLGDVPSAPVGGPTTTSVAQQPPTTTQQGVTTTTAPGGNSIETPEPIQPGMTAICNKFKLVTSTTTCQSIVDDERISMVDFLRWNSGINAGCTNIWLNTYACVGVIGGAPPPTTTSVGNGVATPSPIQPGLVSNCNRFHDIKVGTTCQAIADYNKIALTDFYKWNPGVNSGCTNLMLGAYTCTGIIGGGSNPPTTTTMPANGVTTPLPIQPGMVSNCNRFHDVKVGTTCQAIADYNKFPLANFYKWNPGVNSGCTNLIVGAYTCTGIIGGGSTPPTTTVPSNGVNTPLPIQPGMVSNCNKFHDVKVGTTCQAIADYNKIALTDFYRWNPAINSGCTNLILGAYTCTGIIGGGSTPPTTTTPSNGVNTPSPIQPGMVSNCNKFHDVKVGTTCAAIISYNKIEATDFYKWNPRINTGCTNLNLGAFVCTGVIGGSTTPTNPGNGISTPTPIQPGMVSNCNKFHDVKVGTTCAAIISYNKIEATNFYRWNTGINSGCTNLFLGAYVCTGVIGGSTTPTNPGNGISTPTPIQPGMVSNCNKFHDVKVGTTCAAIISYNKIEATNFYRWNTGINSGCTNLFLGSWVCTGVI